MEERTRCSPIWPSTPRSASDARRRPWKSPGASARKRKDLRTFPQPIRRDPTQPDGREGGGLRTCERCAQTVTLMRNAASIAVAATADHGGATATTLWRRYPLSPTLEIVRTTDAGSVADADDHPTEGRQDDSLQRELTRRPFAVSGLRSWSAICASRIIATCCSCRCRRVGAERASCHRWRRDEHEPDHRVVVGLPTIRRQPTASMMCAS